MNEVVFVSDNPVRIEDGSQWGGTEATLELIANWLVDNGVKVGIVSPTKRPGVTRRGVSYYDEEHWLKDAPLKIFMRRGMVSPLEIKHARMAFSWIHDYPNAPSEIKAFTPRLGVSKFLINHLWNAEKHANDKIIWNPVNPKISEYKKEGKRSDNLIWISGWQKGIQEAISMYISLYDKGMKRELDVLMPSWSDMPIPISKKTLEEYPINLHGVMPWETCMEMLSNSACLFRAGFTPETFGLIYAEANSLGVPVVTFDAGAAREVLTEGNMIISEKTNLDDVYKWIDGVESRTVKPNPDYDIERVGKRWLNFIAKYNKE